jgi:ribosomal protein L10
MAISKDQKKQLMQQYIEDLSSANNVVVMKQDKVSVNNATRLRKDIASANGRYNVIRKRIFIKALKEA